MTKDINNKTIEILKLPKPFVLYYITDTNYRVLRLVFKIIRNGIYIWVIP